MPVSVTVSLAVPSLSRAGPAIVVEVALLDIRDGGDTGA